MLCVVLKKRSERANTPQATIRADASSLVWAGFVMIAATSPFQAHNPKLGYTLKMFEIIRQKRTIVFNRYRGNHQIHIGYDRTAFFQNSV
jgi:hypothetical protein